MCPCYGKSFEDLEELLNIVSGLGLAVREWGVGSSGCLSLSCWREKKKKKIIKFYVAIL
jgi:hypothetical protein